MNTAIVDAVRSGADAVAKAASDDWRVSAGMIAAGFAIGLFEAIRRWRNRKRSRAFTARGRK